LRILDFKLSPVLNVVYFFLGNPLASEFYMPTFRNIFSVPFSSYKDGTDRVFGNVGIQNSDAEELPRRKHTTNCVSFGHKEGY
jgi:hypothetical protein